MKRRRTLCCNELLSFEGDNTYDLPRREPSGETTNYTTELGCNLGLAGLSEALFKIRAPKMKAAALPAAFPGGFPSSSGRCRESLRTGRQIWQRRRSDRACKRQRPARSCLRRPIRALYYVV